MLTIYKRLLNDSFKDDFDGFTLSSSLESPQKTLNIATDVIETENEIRFTLDLPGIAAESIDVKVENNVLSIKGERKTERKEEGKYHLIERTYGKFTRSFRLPTTVDAEKTNANYEAGVLMVSLPKKEEVKPKAIQVKIAS